MLCRDMSQLKRDACGWRCSLISTNNLLELAVETSREIQHTKKRSESQETVIARARFVCACECVCVCVNDHTHVYAYMFLLNIC